MVRLNFQALRRLASWPIATYNPIFPYNRIFFKAGGQCGLDAACIPLESERRSMSSCLGSFAAGARTYGHDLLLRDPLQGPEHLEKGHANHSDSA
jgi:hypothetical protein